MQPSMKKLLRTQLYAEQLPKNLFYVQGVQGVLGEPGARGPRGDLGSDVRNSSVTQIMT